MFQAQGQNKQYWSMGLGRDGASDYATEAARKTT